jgi:hypothetical protein
MSTPVRKAAGLEMAELPDPASAVDGAAAAAPGAERLAANSEFNRQGLWFPALWQPGTAHAMLKRRSGLRIDFLT